MTLPQPYDGPRLLRSEEAWASHRLSQACFGAFAGEAPAGEAPEERPGEPAAATPVEKDQQRGETHVITYNGEPVSQISIFYTPLRVYESVLGVGSIGGVCTLPDQRQHGLATLLLDHCARQLVEMGASLMLISGGRGLYTRAGCVPTGGFATFTARGGAQGDGSPAKTGETIITETGLALRPAGPSDAFAAARLYQAEPVHFMRSLERFSERFGRQQTGKDVERWMLERDGRAQGYLLLSSPWEYANRPEEGVREVDEYAGSTDALAEAVCAAVEQGGIRELSISVAGQDAALIDLLTRRLGPPEWTPLPGHTMRILDFPGLMVGLHDYMRARLPSGLLHGLSFEQKGPLVIAGSLFGRPADSSDPGACAITRGSDRLELSTADMTQLVMGDPQGRLSLDPPGALSDVVEALFPLPAFLPGLDYH